MTAHGTAFASDFDGTLCESDWATHIERFDPADIEAVRRYQANGGLFGICTGRPLSAVLNSLKGKLELDFYIVTTGAQVFDRDLNPIFSKPFPLDVAHDICTRYGGGDTIVLAVTSEAFVSVGRSLGPELPSVASVYDVPGTLLGVSLDGGTEQSAARTNAHINERYQGVVEGFQNLGSIDLVPAGCSKGAGVHIIKEALGVDCIGGAGDSFNDLPLLRAADVSYTFHKSPAEVQEAATCVVHSIAEALADFTER